MQRYLEQWAAKLMEATVTIDGDEENRLSPRQRGVKEALRSVAIEVKNYLQSETEEDVRPGLRQ